MANCSGITQGSTYDCVNPIQPGVNQRLILGNWDDIASITYDVTNPYIITDVTMKSTKQCYAFEGVRQSLAPQYSAVPATVSYGYSHQIDFSVFDISPAQKENLEAMAVKKQFAIVQNINDTGNGGNYFELYGTNLGLDMISNVRIPGDSDTAGAFVITLQTSEDSGKENKMPATWNDGVSFESTLVLVDALLTPAA